MRKKFKTLFLLSVLLNLFLLGAGLGTFAKRAYDNPWSHAAKDLAPETQSLVARAFQKARRDMQGTRNEFRSARKQISRLLQKDELDEEAYEKAMQRMQKAQQKMHARKTAMMKDLMADLPPEERKKLSARLMKPFGKSREAIYKLPHNYPKPEKPKNIKE